MYGASVSVEEGVRGTCMVRVCMMWCGARQCTRYLSTEVICSQYDAPHLACLTSRARSPTGGGLTARRPCCWCSASYMHIVSLSSDSSTDGDGDGGEGAIMCM